MAEKKVFWDSNAHTRQLRKALDPFRKTAKRRELIRHIKRVLKGKE